MSDKIKGRMTKNSFTLIELIVVIAIIAILAAIIAPNAFRAMGYFALYYRWQWAVI